MNNNLKELLNAEKAFGTMFNPGLMIICVVLLFGLALLLGSSGE